MKACFTISLLLTILVTGYHSVAQEILADPTRRIRRTGTTGTGMNTSGNITAPGAAGMRKDTLSLTRRDDRKDSVAVYWRYLDSAYRHYFDSSVNDFDNYFSVPSSYQYLGNNGLAAFPLIFSPEMNPGWDEGFHAFDIYRFTVQNSKLYRTNRPFSMLSYQLASGKEQMVSALHTQNPRPNINFGLEYRMINAPGFFVNQNTNHNNYRLFASYTGRKKRYNAQFIFAGNTIRASENGGIVNDTLLSDPNKKKRFSIPVNLGNDFFNPNPFSTTVKTGNRYDDFTFFFRHGYDIGTRDSVQVNDSTMEYLFYPRLRIRHGLTYSSRKYRYEDEFGDSAVYSDWYDVNLSSDTDTFSIYENWKVLSNDLSLISFPDAKNTAHYLMAGVCLQNISSPTAGDFSNFSLHAEYRLPTRNRKWNMELFGQYYLSGYNSGDYLAKALISRYLNPRFGFIRLHFANVNRTPSFVFDERSAFNLGADPGLSKENNISIGASSDNKFARFGFRNHLLTNFTYLTDHYNYKQYGKVINVLQLYFSKTFRLARHWNWYLDVTYQQTDPSSPVRVPQLFTRNRIAFEGLFFKNLNLSTGVEVRYYTPFEAQDYSPVLGRFFVQDSMRISNLPDVAAFAHFRIKGFTGYLRAENLNTIDLSNGLSFTNNNFAAPHYPTQGLMIRVGIKWFFVN